MVLNKTPENTLNLIVKAQDKGTLETLLDQITKSSSKYPDKIVNIISANVGPVTENEIRVNKLKHAAL